MGESLRYSPLAKTYIYDSPDGQDCLKKTFHSAKLGALIGGYFGAIDIVAISKPTGILAVTGRALTFVTPAAGAAATFAMTAGIVGDIRGKDSPLNHGLGAFAGGCILATRFSNKPMGLGVAFVLALVASAMKKLNLSGERILPGGLFPQEQWQFYKYGPKNNRGFKEPTNY
ncbi:hypothetical protein LSH36_86g06076 [Paralvinella palmiformis]|uniref:NADH dehydrogenase [ubiquinone] 1 alpha subcomplex subunit 11 n=1 Tax=Paralvinella palmiformis TaxID=53620 RepID=A0AAD9K1A6_9ANNE|nr:hypothetical protein LSH36_86g06076 [Paralvinella palmiformis]